MTAPRIDSTGDGAVLWIRVQPRAKRDAVAGVYGDAVKISLKAPPVDGAANKALLKFLGRICGVAPSTIEVVSGHSGRSKRVAFRTLDVASLTRRMEEVLG